MNDITHEGTFYNQLPKCVSYEYDESGANIIFTVKVVKDFRDHTSYSSVKESDVVNKLLHTFPGAKFYKTRATIILPRVSEERSFGNLSTTMYTIYNDIIVESILTYKNLATIESKRE